ncbi:hypothetical protein JEQ12_018753, partial [Ovis aries]
KPIREWTTVARSSQSRPRYLCGRQEPPALAGPGSRTQSLERAAASPALLGAGVLHHGHVPELEGVDRHEYQRHVGPSSSQNASSSFHHRLWRITYDFGGSLSAAMTSAAALTAFTFFSSCSWTKPAQQELEVSALAWSISITSSFPSSPLAMNFLWSKELQEEVQKLNCKTYWALKEIFKRLQFKVMGLEQMSLDEDDALALLDIIKVIFGNKRAGMMVTDYDNCVALESELANQILKTQTGFNLTLLLLSFLEGKTTRDPTRKYSIVNSWGGLAGLWCRNLGTQKSWLNDYVELQYLADPESSTMYERWKALYKLKWYCIKIILHQFVLYHLFLIDAGSF